MSEYNHKIEKNVESESCYCHINDGGISLSINRNSFSDKDKLISLSPTLIIKGTNYGVQLCEIKLPTTSKSLEVLGEWLIKESKKIKNWEIPSTHSFEFYTESSDNRPIYSSVSGSELE